jgi:cytoskeletal protein RodZ
MKRVVSILVIAAFLAAPMLVSAQQAKPAAPAAPAAAPAAPAVAPAAPAAPAPAPAAPAKPATAKKATKKAETVTVVGMVEEVKDKKGKVTGYTLKTDTDTYSVAKGKKVAAMVGKKVEATGTVSTAKSGKKVLTVKQMKEAM